MKNGEILSGILEEAFDLGEVPYQANRNALNEFDVLENRVKGLKELSMVTSGIDVFIKKLEDFKDAARDIARASVATLR